MSRRLATGGRRIQRDIAVPFTFNGRAVSGFAGDTLASALLAAGQTVFGRSFKYHRKRGVLASGVEEPNALMGLGEGAVFEPNQRATVTPLVPGLQAQSQNHWPSLEFDVGAINAGLARFFPAGFYYKTFIHPRAAWKHLFEPVIRQAAGLGQAPTTPDAQRYEYFYAYTDVLVVGGGVAGLTAARAAVAAGKRVLLMEQAPVFGGRAPTEGERIDGLAPEVWVERTVAGLRDAGVSLRPLTTVAGLYDHGYVLAEERLTGPLRHRLWRIRAGQIITATGAFERPLSFAGNDAPGVMLAAAMRDYVDLYGVAPAVRTVLVTNNDDAYRTALALKGAGLSVPAVLDLRPVAAGALPEAARAAGLRVEAGTGIARVLQRGDGVAAVETCRADGSGRVLERIACDGVAMSGGWSPAVHLWSQVGGKLSWDAGGAMFRPDPARPPVGADGRPFVHPAGAANGALTLNAALADAAAAAGRATGSAAAVPEGVAPEESAILAQWVVPAKAGKALRAKAFLDFQNDVKVADVQLAAQEGFESVEHTKRYTTLGMATDQGKTSNINGLAVLAEALDKPIPEVGTTTFRPPFTPIALGSIAGEARGALFKPLRRTPMDAWHDAHGAHWEPVAEWRRPYAYCREGERVKDAVRREILNTRAHVGLLDASTLGKILVAGRDAARFLDLVYTNKMSSLSPGRCRYGLMCTESGFLFDDGVVARLSDQAFLCHTTSGGADRVYGWLEEWLQTEWWDLDVHLVNLTEQFAQIAVVGPKARSLLERLGGLDVGRDALRFMGWAEGTLGGIQARVFRISFSGELSYEVAVPAGAGPAFWEACLAAGADLGVMPYGTEALHVMRAEKGFIMIGDETDGTVTPQDLNLGWAVSSKKADFIGRRAMALPHLTDPDRKQLVGLLTEDPRVVLPDGAHAITGGTNVYGQAEALGHVTSSYFSPTLGRSIAMGLIRGGARRAGETLVFQASDVSTIRARVVDPVFYDPEGTRQDV
ncbi:MAG: sarcosine oxidase subunit alpha family protein [Pseudomonadota bacterium]